MLLGRQWWQACTQPASSSGVKGREGGGKGIERELETVKVRYKELGRTDGQTVAHGRVLTTNGTKNGGDRGCIVFFLQDAQEQSPGSGSNEGGSWWSAEESQLIKVPTARYSDFSIAGEQLRSEEKRGRKRKGNNIVNACEQGARVSSLQMEANAERRTSGQRGYTQPTTSANESQYGPVPSGGNDWI